MYKKGKYVLVIGAVVVVLLMVSSTCAVNVETPNIKTDISHPCEIFLTIFHCFMHYCRSTMQSHVVQGI